MGMCYTSFGTFNTEKKAINTEYAYNTNDFEGNLEVPIFEMCIFAFRRQPITATKIKKHHFSAKVQLAFTAT